MSYTSPQSLAGKVIIVTGASRGVGRGIARALSKNGAHLALTDVVGEALDSAADEMRSFGAEVVSVQADLTHSEAPQAIVDVTIDHFGRLDGLVNNAIWINSPTPFIDQTDETFTRISDTGPRATFALMKAAHPHLVAAGGGSIVNLGSGAGAAGEEGFAAYGAAKESIRGLTKVAALEWGADRIRVNVVLPFANSEGALAWEKYDPDAFARAMAANPMRRIGDTEKDVGAVVSFLLGDDSTYLTAQSIHISGGAGTFR
ncbi:MAG TPA: SDR family NAD(P)-dependent oxidoreductase [Pseudolysinimonas sp.]|nr:SDR family NAD(P)-dependent oxidoreductase [Pseudolysinimonas sp.]